MGMGRVFDNFQIVLFRNLKQLRHFSGQSPEMDDHDGFGLVCNLSTDILRINTYPFRFTAVPCQR